MSRTRKARFGVLVALLMAAVGCALVLSASATMKWALDSKVPAEITPFAVGMLEVVMTTGTILWISSTGALRTQAVGSVVLGSLVTLGAGLHTYGPFGLVAPCSMVIVIHLVAAAWKENHEDAGVTQEDPEQDEEPSPAPTVTRAATVPQDDPAPQDQDTGPPTQPMPRPVPAPPADPVPVTMSGDEDILRVLRSEGGDPSISAIKKRWSVGSGKATRIHQTLNAA